MYPFRSALYALLASDFEPYMFDTWVERLDQIRFAWDQAKMKFWPLQWLEAYEHRNRQEELNQTLWHLENLCEMPMMDRPHDDYDFIHYLGLSCEAASQAFQHRLRQRQGGGTKDLTTLMSSAGETLRFSQFIQSVHDSIPPPPELHKAPGGLTLGTIDGHNAHFHSYQFPTTLTSFRAICFEGILDLEPASGRPDFCEPPAPDAPAEAVQSFLRALLIGTLNQALSQAERTEGVVAFQLFGLDTVEAVNPGSPIYWAPTSVEFRAVMEQNYPIDWWFADIPVVAFAPGRAEAEAQNILQLRRFINRYANGNLPKLAEAAGLAPLWVHQMMRSGRITESDLDRLLEAVRLAPEERGPERAVFVFSPKTTTPTKDDPTKPRRGTSPNEFAGLSQTQTAQTEPQPNTLDLHQTQSVAQLAGLKPPGVLSSKSRTPVLKPAASDPESVNETEEQPDSKHSVVGPPLEELLEPTQVSPPDEPIGVDGYGAGATSFTLAALLRATGIYSFTTFVKATQQEYKHVTGLKDRVRTSALWHLLALKNILLERQPGFNNEGHSLKALDARLYNLLARPSERQLAQWLEAQYRFLKEELSLEDKRGTLWVPIQRWNPKAKVFAPDAVGSAAFMEGVVGPTIRPRWGPLEEAPKNDRTKIREARFPGPLSIVGVATDPVAGALFRTKTFYSPAKPFVRLENVLHSSTWGLAGLNAVSSCRVCRVAIQKTTAEAVIEAMQKQMNAAFEVAKVIDDVFRAERSINLVDIKRKDPKQAFVTAVGESGTTLFGLAHPLEFVPVIGNADENGIHFEAEAIQIFKKSDWQLDVVLLQKALEDGAPFTLEGGTTSEISLESYLQFLEDQWVIDYMKSEGEGTSFDAKEAVLHFQRNVELGIEPNTSWLKTFNPINAFMHHALQDRDDRALYIAILSGPNTVRIVRFWRKNAQYPNGRMYFTPEQAVEPWNHWSLDEPHPKIDRP